jgi:aflatoxin B1 aldehyde reductase
MSHPGLQIIFGLNGFKTEEAIATALKTVSEAGVTEIDTAHIYNNGLNEVHLGAAGVGDGRFNVSTKNAGGVKSREALLPENVQRTAMESLEKLKVKQLDIFYIHSPDRNMTLDEWVPEIQKLYEKGVFKRFGVSNFSPEEVQELHDYCKKKGYVLPSVYQGNYSAIARKFETTLFPTLRKLNMAFYAYSPLAGGFLTKTREALEQGHAGGRWSKDAPSKHFQAMFVKPSYLDVLGKWGDIAEKEGVSKALLAYRWISYHSALKPEYGDALILGASRTEQIRESVGGLKEGPLKPESAKAIDELWQLVEKDAPTSY